MSTLLGIKFRDYGQIYYFDSGAFVVNEGDSVLVKTEQGMGLGKVVQKSGHPSADDQDIKSIYRLAGEEDLKQQEENEALAKEARHYCRQRIKERNLDMKLVDVEVFFDRGKLIFYFTAPSRIDFRDLVKDLVKAYRTRIELRQIGVRHETQMVGAMGNCGLVCCCRGFLRKFAPVTIKMAKEQNLFLNPSKISGMCGRLLCCLSYEQENYENFHRNCPKIGKKYATDQGLVKVIRSNLFRNSLTIINEMNEEVEVTIEDWQDMNPSRPDPEQLQNAQQNQQQQQPQPKQPPRPRPKPKPKSKAPATYDVDSLQEFTLEAEEAAMDTNVEAVDPSTTPLAPDSTQSRKSSAKQSADQDEKKQGKRSRGRSRSRKKKPQESKGQEQIAGGAKPKEAKKDETGTKAKTSEQQQEKKPKPKRRRRKNKSKSGGQKDGQAGGAKTDSGPSQ